MVAAKGTIGSMAVSSAIASLLVGGDLIFNASALGTIGPIVFNSLNYFGGSVKVRCLELA